MFTRILKRLRKRMDAKRTFRIHIITFNTQSAEVCLKLLPRANITERSTETQNIHLTLEAHMRLSELRSAIDAMPHDVAAAYEELQA